MYTCELTSLTTVINNAYRSSRDQTSFNVLACQLFSLKLWFYLRYYHCQAFVHCLAVFVFGDFYELFSVKASKYFHVKGQRHSRKVVLFEHNSYTVRWTTVLRSREGWPEACGEPYSIKLVSITFCEPSMWILHSCNAWLLGIVMSMQVSRCTAHTERFNLKAIQY